MSLEIEVVDGVQSRNSNSSSAGDAAAPGSGTNDDVSDEGLRDNVYAAAAYGDMEKLQRLVECEGYSVSVPDGLGYYALQWAALNNRIVAAQYIIEHGGDVNVADHTGQTALHWSAVRGAIQFADLLLEAGARLNASDMYGYQITHVAAQYGHTAFLYHIVSKWSADPDVLDSDGKSPLHWAAYKGFADCIRLLLYLDAYRGRQDKEGCTPLHWAAIRGNLEACTMLVQAGKVEDLMVTANNGRTPAQLASFKNHRQVAYFLGNARRLLNKSFKTPILWCVILLLLMIYMHSVIIASNLPKLTAGFSLVAWLGIFLAAAGLVMCYRCSSNDPGFIEISAHDPQSMKDDEPLLKIEMNNPALLAGNWFQLCPKCKIVRPVRARHCFICDRCVEQFDHHCPLLSNCIGKKNKRDFFMFLIVQVSAMMVTGSVALARVLTDPTVGAVSFLVVDCFLFCFVALLTVSHAYKISRNITTDELANGYRYGYLRGPSGRFRNPYDHGIKRNCWDLLIKGYNEDVECGQGDPSLWELKPAEAQHP